jgi:DNA processing protein
VFAYPGNVGNDYSAGCNGLIKNHKAFLIENASDLEKIMGWESQDVKQKNVIEPSLFLELSDTEKQIMDILKGSEAIHINQISSKLEMPMSKISPLLLEMEFKGLIKCLPGNLYKFL